MVYGILKFITASFCKLLIKKIGGIENIPKDKGIIFAINHSSILDTILFTSFIASKFDKKLHNLGKQELFNSWFGKIFHKTIETIPIDRNSKGDNALIKALAYLENGEFVGIYPEGTRSNDGLLGRGKTGVVRLALKSHKIVIPVGIIGTFELLPKNKRFPRIRKIVEINIGKPISFELYHKEKISKELLRSLTTKVMKEIGVLINQTYYY